MQFIQGSNRNQTYFATLEDQVSADNPVRLIELLLTNLTYRDQDFLLRYTRAKAGRLMHLRCF